MRELASARLGTTAAPVATACSAATSAANAACGARRQRGVGFPAAVPGGAVGVPQSAHYASAVPAAGAVEAAPASGAGQSTGLPDWWPDAVGAAQDGATPGALSQQRPAWGQPEAAAAAGDAAGGQHLAKGASGLQTSSAGLPQPPPQEQAAGCQRADRQDSQSGQRLQQHQTVGAAPHRSVAPVSHMDSVAPTAPAPAPSQCSDWRPDLSQPRGDGAWGAARNGDGREFFGGTRASSGCGAGGGGGGGAGEHLAALAAERAALVATGIYCAGDALIEQLDARLGALYADCQAAIAA